jgi:hypothetical protein
MSNKHHVVSRSGAPPSPKSTNLSEVAPKAERSYVLMPEATIWYESG